jgi:F0F1-type ATP synthase assembly protein I
VSFPELVLAGLIVGAGIYALDQFSATAAWLLTFLLLLIIGFRYEAFASELSKILSVSSPVPKQDPNFVPSTGDIGSIPVH